MGENEGGLVTAAASRLKRPDCAVCSMVIRLLRRVMERCRAASCGARSDARCQDDIARSRLPVLISRVPFIFRSLGLFG